MPRYIIIGAGAVGGTIGARLFESGHDVVLVARGAHLDAVRSSGLRLRTPESETTLAVPAVAGPDELTARPEDVLILATKTQHSESALDTWRCYGHTDPGSAFGAPPLILAQNGVANERLALRRLPRVYGMCVWLPATHLEPGVVEARGIGISGILHLGRYPDGADDFIRSVGEDLEKSHFLAPVNDDVMRWKYAKLLGNLANAVEALAGPVDNPEAEELMRRARAEGVAVLTKAGIDFASQEEQAPLRKLLRTGPPVGTITTAATAGGSTWQSLQRGAGSTEADYLNGEIVLLGRLHGVPTPVNEALQELAARHAHDRRPPGSVSAAELLRSLS